MDWFDLLPLSMVPGAKERESREQVSGPTCYYTFQNRAAFLSQ